MQFSEFGLSHSFGFRVSNFVICPAPPLATAQILRIMLSQSNMMFDSRAHGGAFMAIRPILLSAILTAIFAAGFASIAKAADEAPQVANTPFQFSGVVNADSVLLRSGPGENYYITGKLAKG